MDSIEISTEVAKATPPLAVAGLTVLGVSLNDLVLLATLVYVLMQIGFLAFKWLRIYRRGTKNE